jgi:hypothetical protein
LNPPERLKQYLISKTTAIFCCLNLIVSTFLAALCKSHFIRGTFESNLSSYTVGMLINTELRYYHVMAVHFLGLAQQMNTQLLSQSKPERPSNIL